MSSIVRLRYFSFWRYFILNFKMSGKTAMERVKENAEIAKKTIEELKNELNIVNREYNFVLAKRLQDENIKLVAAIEEAKRKLTQLEIENCIKQVSLPTQTVSNTQIEEQLIEKQSTTKSTTNESKEKSKKEKKSKEQKEIPVEPPVDIGRLDLRIAKIEDVQKHPDADSLYVLKINCGEHQPRTVCSGLVKHVTIEELQNRSVVLLCNLKPVKMRGITSEAMVMCASSEAGVEVLTPPEGAIPGDVVECEGYVRQPDHPVMNPKKKIFETVAPDLHTNDQLQACYKNVPFTVHGKGFCLAKSLKNVAVK